MYRQVQYYFHLLGLSFHLKDMFQRLHRSSESFAISDYRGTEVTEVIPFSFS